VERRTDGRRDESVGGEGWGGGGMTQSQHSNSHTLRGHRRRLQQQRLHNIRNDDDRNTTLRGQRIAHTPHTNEPTLGTLSSLTDSPPPSRRSAAAAAPAAAAQSRQQAPHSRPQRVRAATSRRRAARFAKATTADAAPNCTGPTCAGCGGTPTETRPKARVGCGRRRRGGGNRPTRWAVLAAPAGVSRAAEASTGAGHPITQGMSVRD
jgi:hypothetical protein